MNEGIIERHNEVVKPIDTVVHAGDTCFGSPKMLLSILEQLNGTHLLLLGSHDRAIDRIVKKNKYAEKDYGSFIYRGRRLELTIKNKSIIISHYCMRVWAKSHYNSWHLFGHSHGRLAPVGKSWDIGVDNNNFYPISFEQVCEIMDGRPDNPNLIPEIERKHPRRKRDIGLWLPY